MLKNKTILRISLCLVAVMTIILAGCSPKATATIDPNLIYTQAAETVAAEMASESTQASTQIDANAIYTQAAQTVIAELTLNAPEPTATETQPAVRPSATPQEGATSEGEPVFEVTATIKPTSATKVDDVAQFIYQWPGDDYEFNAGGKFDAVFQFKNVGETTWNSSYTLRWYMGDKLGMDKLKFTFEDASNNKTVAPGEVAEITIPGLTAPLGAGTYQSNWRLCNDDAKCFYLVYIQIVVK